MNDFRAGGLRAEWENDGLVVGGSVLPVLLAIAPVDALHLGGHLVPTAGVWERDGDEACFTPRFAPVAGSVYVLLARQDARDDWRELARLTVPGSQPVRSTWVESIDPGGEVVPANLLRFSVTFSEAMEEGTAAGHVHLRDANGGDLPGTLFEMPPELWDRDRRRLTVLLEPGRIKRGLQPHVQAGPPLREGETVTVVVDPNIRDAAGAELAAGAERSYRVGRPVRSRVDPSRWEVGWPDAPHEPLVVRFGRPLDRALVRRCLRLEDGQGHPVPGRASLDAGSMVWVFTPAVGETAAVGDRAGAEGDRAWRLHVDTRLEDLAGNSVRRVFDRDLQRAGDDSVDAALVVLTPDGRVQLRPRHPSH